MQEQPRSRLSDGCCASKPISDFVNPILQCSPVSVPSPNAFHTPLHDFTAKSSAVTFGFLSDYLTQKISNPNASAYFILSLQQADEYRQLLTHMVRVTPPLPTQQHNSVLLWDMPDKSPKYGKLLSANTRPSSKPAEYPNAFIGIVKFRGVKLLALFDTGATHSLISDTAVTKFGLKHDFKADIPALQAANGNLLQVKGTVTSDLWVGNYKAVNTSLLVMKEMMEGIDILLGMDWCTGNSVKFDCENMAMKIGK